MNLRYHEEKPNVHGLGHEWYFDLDYLTNTLGYKHDKANQSAGTQEATTNPAGTQDVDSDSDCDEQVIIVPSYPSHSIQGTEPKDTSGDDVDDSPLNFADEIFQRELARLKAQEQRATSDAERHGLGIPVPTGSIPVPSGDTMVSTDDVSVHTSSPTDSFFNDEPITRFPSPSDLGNHDPSPGIFSSPSYDDEFGAALNNVASTVERDNHTDFQHCLFACFFSQVEPSSVAQALEDPSWIDSMQEEMQQFKFQNVWLLVDLPEGKYAIGTKWILKNKRDARGIVVRNKARLVAQGHRQEEGIDYDEALMKGEFQMSAMGELTFFLCLQVQQRPDGIFIDQDKYVQEILNKFDLGSVRTATTPYEAPKPKSKKESDSPVNVHLYRSMICSLMYLTASRLDIMFVVSACSRNQVTLTTSNLKAVKKIFKYFKGQPKLGLWYPRESPLMLEAYSDNDYDGANKERKSTTGGCTLDTKSVVRLWV
nr:ribonuclease H-like domain, reverse transcriptase, RNA-dependent DNA polymerase [Tanacetum cinerariifolium]